MTDRQLVERVTARIRDVEGSSDPEAVLTPEAEQDVMRLLAESAIEPGEPADFEPYYAAFFTFVYRVVAGERNPVVPRDNELATCLYAYLRLHLPDPSVLPRLPEGVPAITDDVLAVVAGRAWVMAVAHEAVGLAAAHRGEIGQACAHLDRSAAWLQGAISSLPEGHGSLEQLTAALLGVHKERFDLRTDAETREIADRVAARYAEVAETGEPDPLLTPEAGADLRRLVCRAAPEPDGPIEPVPLLLAYLTYGRRAAVGDLNPDAEADGEFALLLRLVVRPYFPGRNLVFELPPGVEEPETDPLSRRIYLAMLIGASCDVLAAGATGSDTDAALLVQGATWLHAVHAETPVEHEAYGEITLLAVALEMRRFDAGADPDSLARAAALALEACTRVPTSHPHLGDKLPLALDVLAGAAFALGEPSWTSVQELAAQRGIEPLPRATRLLEMLSQIEFAPGTGSEEREAAMAGFVFDAAVQAEDLSLLACAAIRLYKAAEPLPEGHPNRSSLISALHQAYAQLGWDTGRIPATAADPAARLDAAIGRALGLMRIEDGRGMARAFSQLDRILALAEEAARAHGLDGLPAELNAAVAFLGVLSEPGTFGLALGSQRTLARCRRAFASLPREHALWPAYGVVLAARAQDWSESLRADNPAQARDLEVLARSVSGDLEAAGLDDFPPWQSLRDGKALEALLRGIVALRGNRSAEAERALTVMGSAYLGSFADRLGTIAKGLDEEYGNEVRWISALGNLAVAESDTTPLASLLPDFEVVLEQPVPDGVDQPELGKNLGGLLALRAEQDFLKLDQNTASRTLGLLRSARATADQSAEFSARLAKLMMTQGLMSMDPALLIEASAVYSDADSAGSAPGSGGAASEFSALAGRISNDKVIYLIAYDPEHLEQARRAVPELLRLAELADAELGGGGSECRMRARVLRDDLDVVAPAGLSNTRITDEVVERCRDTFRSMPEGMLREASRGTLLAALMGRADALREADPEASVRLRVEAAALGDSAPGIFRATGNMIRLGWLRDRPELSEQPDPSARRTETGPGFQMPEAFKTFIGRMTGAPGVAETDPGAGPGFSVRMLRHPMAPLAFRVKSGLMAASEAILVHPPRFDESLEYAAEAVQLLERLTDRGASNESSELALTAVEGLICNYAAQFVFFNLASTALTASQHLTPMLGQRLQAFERLVDDAVAVEVIDGDERAEQLQETVASLAELAAQIKRSVEVRTFSGEHVNGLVSLHERGRGLLLSRRLEARADLGSLRTAYPDLADGFEQLTARLEPGDAVDDRERFERLRISGELDELIARIRACAGFEDFLSPLPPARLCALAAPGPVVVLNHAPETACVAFVVTAGAITALLLEARAEEVADAVLRLNQAIAAIYARGRARLSPGELREAGRQVEEVLSWTWHSIVKPVFDRLGYAEPVGPAAEWPRLWWIPTGPFSALPLHAAQCTLVDCPRDDCGSALDLAAASFTPGFRTLAFARTRLERHSGGVARALVVSEVDDELPGVESLADYSAAALAADSPLVGREATREAVLAGLEASDVVQFSCHAQSSADEPSGSRILLPGGEDLLVSDIYRARPDSARLAVLTACGTARSAERLADEAVNLASAFMLAGYPEAVGTLWETEVPQTDAFLRELYPALREEAMPAPLAVHRAVLALRARNPRQPHLWASFMHAGT